MQQLNYLDNKIFILKEFLDGLIPSQEPASSFYLISLMERMSNFLIEVRKSISSFFQI